MAEGETDYLALVSALGSHAKARRALRACKAERKEAKIAQDAAKQEQALIDRVQQREKRRFHTKGQPARDQNARMQDYVVRHGASENDHVQQSTNDARRGRLRASASSRATREQRGHDEQAKFMWRRDHVGTQGAATLGALGELSRNKHGDAQGQAQVDDGTHALSLPWRALPRLPPSVVSTLALQIARPIGVTHAWLQGNALTSLPTAFYRFYLALETLDLSRNQLSILPREVGCLTSLRELRLDHNKLEALPDQLCELHKLTVLQARSNKLSALPRRFGVGLRGLRALMLDNNVITQLPATLTALTSLRCMRLAGNPLPCLAMYPQLSKWEPDKPKPADPGDVYDEMIDPVLRRRVWMSRATGEVRLTRPDCGEIRKFGAAQRLGAAVDDGTEEEEALKERRRAVAKEKTRATEKLSALGFSMGADTRTGVDVKVLDRGSGGSGRKAVGSGRPVWWADLTSEGELCFRAESGDPGPTADAHGYVYKMPLELDLWGSMSIGKNLVELRLRDCQLLALPDSLCGGCGADDRDGDDGASSRLALQGSLDIEYGGACATLKLLDVGCNSLNRLPRMLGGLAQLETLIADVNMLDELPASTCRLTALRTLELKSNSISTLPAGIGQCAQLEKLSIEGNALCDLPASLGNCTNLTDIELRNNPLTTQDAGSSDSADTELQQLIENVQRENRQKGDTAASNSKKCDEYGNLISDEWDGDWDRDESGNSMQEGWTVSDELAPQMMLRHGVRGAAPQREGVDNRMSRRRRRSIIVEAHDAAAGTQTTEVLSTGEPLDDAPEQSLTATERLLWKLRQRHLQQQRGEAPTVKVLEVGAGGSVRVPDARRDAEVAAVCAKAGDAMQSMIRISQPNPVVENAAQVESDGDENTGGQKSDAIEENTDASDKTVSEDLALEAEKLKAQGSACFRLQFNWKGLTSTSLGTDHVLWTLKHLRALRLNGNNLTSLPTELSQLSALELLHVSGNKQLNWLPPRAFGVTHMPHLREVVFDDGMLEELPPSLCGCLADTEGGVEVEYDAFAEREPMQLQILSVCGNKLRHLPMGFGTELTLLTQLALEHNNLGPTLPPSIVMLESLEVLRLSYNKLGELPEGMPCMMSLRVILANGNKLTKLPADFGNMPSLEDLRVAGNNLCELPSRLGCGTLAHKLRRLWLNRNQLIELPHSFDRMDALVELLTEHNPMLRSPPSSLAATDIAKTMQYLRERAKRVSETKAALSASGLRWRDTNISPTAKHLLVTRHDTPDASDDVFASVDYLLPDDRSAFDRAIDLYCNGDFFAREQKEQRAQDAEHKASGTYVVTLLAELKTLIATREHNTHAAVLTGPQGLIRLLHAVERDGYLGKPGTSAVFRGDVKRPWGERRCNVPCFAVDWGAIFNVDKRLPHQRRENDSAHSDSEETRDAPGGMPTTGAAMFYNERAKTDPIAHARNPATFHFTRNQVKRALLRFEGPYGLIGRVSERIEFDSCCCGADASCAPPYACRVRDVLVVQRIVLSTAEAERKAEEDALIARRVASMHDRVHAFLDSAAGNAEAKLAVSTKKAILAAAVKEARTVEKAALAEKTRSSAALLALERKVKRAKKKGFDEDDPYAAHAFSTIEQAEGAVRETRDLARKAATALVDAKAATREAVRKAKRSTKQLRAIVDEGLLQQEANRIKNEVYRTGRWEAVNNRWRRPWDGRNGRDFARWKVEAEAQGEAQGEADEINTKTPAAVQVNSDLEFQFTDLLSEASTAGVAAPSGRRSSVFG